MDDDARFLIGDGDDEDDDAPDLPPDPCPRCGRTHVAIFYGEQYQTFELQAPIEGLHHNFFNQSSARVSMRTCMDCGYIELYREDLMRLDD
jgi:predicted nucleic-acid-binding Zn-ribbon protein